MLHKYHYLPKLKRIGNVKFWIFALMLGFLQSLLTGMAGGSFVAFLVAFFETFNILFVFSVLNVEYVGYFLKAFVRFFIPLGVFSAIFWDGYLSMDTPHVMVHFAMFAITLFFYPKRYRYFIVGALLFALLIDSSVRSCLLSTAIALFFAIIYKTVNHRLFGSIVRWSHATLYMLPFLLSILGFLGVFNVFQAMEESDSNIELGGKKGDAGRSSTVDSRTVVYADALMNITDAKTLILGHGPAYRIQTFVGFREGASELLEGRGHMESGILNILIFYGLLGCVAFFFLCHYASSMALKSNNSFVKLIALFVAFKFLYSFIEDASINFTTYLAIGICMNNNIRNLTDKEIKDKLTIIFKLQK